MGRLAQQAFRPQEYDTQIGTLNYASGATPQVDVPHTDYTTSIDLIGNQSVVVGATPPVIAGWGAYGPMGLLQVRTTGLRSCFSMPAYHAVCFNTMWNDVYTDSLAASPVAANTTNLWANHIRIPLTIDPVSMKGAWFTGDQNLTLTVALGCNPATTAFSTVNGATIQGSWDVYAHKYSAPDPDEPGGWLNEILYYKQTDVFVNAQQLKNGTTTIPLDVEVDYLRVMVICYTGNNNDATFAPADGLYTRVDLLLNEKIHLRGDAGASEAKQRFDWVQEERTIPKPGVTVFNFMKEDYSVRDVLPTDGTRSIKLLVTSANANAKCDVVIERTGDSQYAERWLAQYMAKHGHAA